MINANLGKNIKRYRESAGLTQDELAKRVGYKGKSTLSLIESGKRDAGSSEILAIANALHIEVTDLLHENDTDQQLITEYAQDKELRRLILFAGANIPKENREKYVEAIINTINTLNSLR